MNDSTFELEQLGMSAIFVSSEEHKIVGLHY